MEIDWKDHELDTIWHHGIKRYMNKEIDQYQLISFIEIQMEKAVRRERLSQMREEWDRHIDFLERELRVAETADPIGMSVFVTEMQEAIKNATNWYKKIWSDGPRKIKKPHDGA